MIKKDEIAQMFKEGLDCSQVVAGHFAKKLGITQETAYKATAAFGGGMGKGETCGAVVGAMVVLGLRYGHSGANAAQQKEIMNVKREEFLRRFAEKYPGYSCKQLLRHDISKPEEFQKILDEGLLFDFCPEIVRDTVEILEEMI